MNGHPMQGVRSPLKVAVGLGASHSGVRPWWLQRLTAIALVPLSIWFLFLLGFLVNADYAVVVGTIARPVNALLLMVFVVCVFWHGMLGLAVIVGDYVHTRWLEITLQVLLRFGAFLCAVAGVMAVLAIWLR